MARGTTLVQLLTDLRAEARLSLAPSQNRQTREVQVNKLQRVQQWLWEDFAWSHLRAERQIPSQAGQRYYNPPSDIQIDKIEKIEVYYAGRWQELNYGIADCDYQAHNSDLNQRAWPLRSWQIYEGEQVEVWPIGDQNGDPTTQEGYLKFTGIRNLKPLVADNDRAELDDYLITMFAAGDMLAASGAKDAQVKIDQATKRYAKLRGGMAPRDKMRILGVGRPMNSQRAFITTYRPPVV